MDPGRDKGTYLQRRNVERVHGAKDKNECQYRVAGVLVGEDGVAVVDIPGNERAGERAGRSCHADPNDGNAKEAAEHHLATADLFDEMRADDGADELFDAVA